MYLQFSLAGGTCEARHKVVILLLPGRHVSWDLSCEDLTTLLFKRVLLLGSLLDFIILGVVLLILVEDVRVVAQIVLVGRPVFVELARGVVGVLHVEVGRGYVVVVDTMLDVLEVLVGHWHANLTEFVNHFVLEVLSSVLKVSVLRVQNLAEGLFRLF